MNLSPWSDLHLLATPRKSNPDSYVTESAQLLSPTPQSSSSAVTLGLPVQDDSDILPAEPVCSPIATRTRIRQAAKQRHSDSDNGGALVDISEPAVCLPALKLSGLLKDITKHHEDFVRCEDVETAAAVKEAMKVQWNAFIFPGQKVKVKVKDEIIPAVIEECHFISKLSYDCLY